MVEVVAALIWDKDRFMICQRPQHKARGLLWEFVGGKVENGESKTRALVREKRIVLCLIHSHLILSECAGFIGTNNSSGAHCFASMHFAHKVVACKHAAHTQCKA